jgi:transcriptional regulator with XRE-family HTH domain
MKDMEFEKALDHVVERLIEIRKKKGISHEHLVKLSGLSRTAISYIEARKSTPSLITCMKLCKALGLDLSKILKETGQ